MLINDIIVSSCAYMLTKMFHKRATKKSLKLKISSYDPNPPEEGSLLRHLLLQCLLTRTRSNIWTASRIIPGCYELILLVPCEQAGVWPDKQTDHVETERTDRPQL